MSDEQKESKESYSAFNFDDTANLVKKFEGDSLSSWSDSKKNDFILLFRNRSRVARVLELLTIDEILELSLKRKLISYGLYSKLQNNESLVRSMSDNYEPNKYYRNSDELTFHGRHFQELKKIAEERANEVIKKLPNVKKILLVVAPEIVKLQEELETIDGEYSLLIDELEAIPTKIDIESLDPATTIKELIDLVQKNATKKEATCKKISEVTERIREITKITDETLKDGVPGVREMIKELVEKMFDHQTGLSEITRRIEEKVRFGDSETAVTLLQHFETDEKAIDPAIKKKFDDAMASLNLTKKLKIRGVKEDPKKKITAQVE